MGQFRFTGFSKFVLLAVPLTTLMVVGLNACSKVEPSAISVTSDAAKDSDTAKNPLRTTVPADSRSCQQTNQNCYTETFQEPTAPSQPLDILFVVQTSDSIATERPTINAGIANFISALPAGADYNVAVMLSHGSTSALSGKLYQVDSEPAVLKSLELSTAQIQSSLGAKLNTIVSDPDAGGGEEGMFSLFNGITTPALLAASQASGFFRPTAALTVVFIADDRDICAMVPVGVPAETDPVKMAARIRDCEGLTAAGLTSRLHLLKGALPLEVHGIIYFDSPVPVDGENEISYGYTDVISLNSGVAIDIATDNIGTELTSAIQITGSSGAVTNSFTLSHIGADSATIKVKVNGSDVPFTVAGDVVTVTQDVPAGATVAISYCIKSTETSKCKKHHHDRWHHDRRTCKNRDHHHENDYHHDAKTCKNKNHDHRH